MTDIVERLKDWSEYDEGKINDTREEAAAEIVRLRADRDAGAKDYTDLMDRHDRLFVENERLRAALKAIDHTLLEVVWEARTALKGDSDE